MQRSCYGAASAVVVIFATVACDSPAGPRPVADRVASAAPAPAPAAVPVELPRLRRVVDGQALALALSEPREDCRTALAAAGDYAQGRAGAWERLDRLEDPLGRAFKGFGHYLAGRFARAERMRELLVDHRLARTLEAPLLEQHIELIRGTFAHCSDETLEPTNGRIVLPAALCWPWQAAPEAADRAYASTRYDWSAWAPEGCGRPPLRRAAPPPRPSCVERYYGLDGPQDFEQSLRCARERGDTRLPVLQLLNGQGVARDLDAAVQTYDRAAYWGRWNVLLALELDERLAHPERAFPDVDYCDVATITHETNECSWLELRRIEQRTAAERALLRRQLSREARRALDALQSAHVNRRKARASLDEDDSFGGTGSAGIVFAAQSVLELRHAEHVQRWLVARRLAPVSAEQLDDLARLHADVSREYLPATAAPEPSPAHGPAAPAAQDDWMSTERFAIDRRRPARLQDVRQSEEQYRRRWVALARRQAPRPLSPEAVERAVLATLLRDQVLELTGESFVPPWRSAFWR